MLTGKEHVRLTRVFRFSASHRLFIKGFSDAENFALFDRCSNPSGHGHDYAVEVSMTGDVDPETGMVESRVNFEKLVRPVIDQLDHGWIDRDVSFFKENVSTVENIGRYLWDELEKVFPGRLDRLRVWENSKSSFEYLLEKTDDR